MLLVCAAPESRILIFTFTPYVSLQPHLTTSRCLECETFISLGDKCVVKVKTCNLLVMKASLTPCSHMQVAISLHMCKTTITSN